MEITCEKCGARPHPIRGCLICEMLSAAAPTPSSQGLETWPLHSEALGVNPNQIEKFTEDAKKKGVPVTFDTIGRPIFESRRQMKAYCKAYGFYNKSEL
jgi:hypothetical protein